MWSSRDRSLVSHPDLPHGVSFRRTIVPILKRIDDAAFANDADVPRTLTEQATYLNGVGPDVCAKIIELVKRPAAKKRAFQHCHQRPQQEQEQEQEQQQVEPESAGGTLAPAPASPVSEEMAVLTAQLVKVTAERDALLLKRDAPTEIADALRSTIQEALSHNFAEFRALNQVQERLVAWELCNRRSLTTPPIQDAAPPTDGTVLHGTAGNGVAPGLYRAEDGRIFVLS